MYDFVDALYRYSQEHCVANILNHFGPGYYTDQRQAAEVRSELEQALGPERTALINRFWDCQCAMGDYDNRAAFLSGLSIGLELGRL